MMWEPQVLGSWLSLTTEQGYMCSWGGLLRVCKAMAQHCNLTLGQRRYGSEKARPGDTMGCKGKRETELGLGIGWAEVRMTWSK